MGNELEMCKQCQLDLKTNEREVRALSEVKKSPKASTVRLNQSACVEFVEEIPRFKGEFNFEKQTAFRKLQKAASEYCEANQIERVHSPMVARLMAYKQTHYFQVIKQLPLNMREPFVEGLEEIDLQLMDSLYHFFLSNTRPRAMSSLFYPSVKVPPAIDVMQIQLHNMIGVVQLGEELVKNGKVALFLMLAGHTEYSASTSKALASIPVKSASTPLELLMKRLKKNLGGQERMSGRRGREGSEIKARCPVVVICCEKNYTAVRELFHRNDFFGLQEGGVKIMLDSSFVPLINSEGKLCVNQQLVTLTHPAGTANAVEVALHPSVKSFLHSRGAQYLHFIGCDNLAQTPCDTLLVGLAKKFERRVAGKCVGVSHEMGSMDRYPRFVASESAYHMMDYNELEGLNDLSMMLEAPLGLNSMLFRVEGMEELCRSYAVSLFMAKRFHMKEVVANYQDWEGKRKVKNGRVFSFQQDIRDYISACPQTILVKYPSLHLRPILSAEKVDSICTGLQVSSVKLY